MMTTKNFYFISQLFHVTKTFFRFRWCAHHRRGRGNSENVLYPPHPGGWAWGVPPGGTPPEGVRGPCAPSAREGGVWVRGVPPGGVKIPPFSVKNPPL